MLMRFDPFRDLDRFTQAANGGRSWPGTALPLDAYRSGDEFTIHIDLPCVDASSIDLTVEKNVLTVKAERRWTRNERDEIIVAERPQGAFTRQLFLGDNLDVDHVAATYNDGVLTLVIPVAERAKPRKVEIKTS